MHATTPRYTLPRTLFPHTPFFVSKNLWSSPRMRAGGELAATLAQRPNQPRAAIVNYLNGSLRLVDQAGGPAHVERARQAARTQAEHAAAVISRVREFEIGRASCRERGWQYV